MSMNDAFTLETLYEHIKDLMEHATDEQKQAHIYLSFDDEGNPTEPLRHVFANANDDVFKGYVALTEIAEEDGATLYFTQE